MPVNTHYCLQPPAATEHRSHIRICDVMLMPYYSKATESRVEVASPVTKLGGDDALRELRTECF